MIQINLLPVREERRRAGIRQLAIMMAAALVGSLLLVGAFYWKQTTDLKEARRNLAATQSEIDSYKKQLKQVEELRATQERIEKKLGVIERLDRSRSGPVRVLDELATHSPERLWLTRVGTLGNQLSLEGMSLDNELVAAFLTALGDSPYFSNVELVSTQAEENDGLKLNKFKLTASITSPGAGVQQTASAGAAAPAGAGR